MIALERDAQVALIGSWIVLIAGVAFATWSVRQLLRTIRGYEVSCDSK